MIFNQTNGSSCKRELIPSGERSEKPREKEFPPLGAKSAREVRLPGHRECEYWANRTLPKCGGDLLAEKQVAVELGVRPEDIGHLGLKSCSLNDQPFYRRTDISSVSDAPALRPSTTSGREAGSPNSGYGAKIQEALELKLSHDGVLAMCKGHQEKIADPIFLLALETTSRGLLAVVRFINLRGRQKDLVLPYRVLSGSVAGLIAALSDAGFRPPVRRFYRPLADSLHRSKPEALVQLERHPGGDWAIRLLDADLELLLRDLRARLEAARFVARKRYNARQHHGFRRRAPEGQEFKHYISRRALREWYPRGSMRKKLLRAAGLMEAEFRAGGERFYRVDALVGMR